MSVAITSWHLLITTFFCAWLIANAAARDRNVQTAPHITEPDAEEAAERAYKEGESVTMVCVSNPESNAVYTWKKDGRLLDLSQAQYRRLPNRGGSFIILNPSDKDEGVYQCFARNQYGTAVSVKSRLRKAVLEPFRTVTEAEVHRPAIGRDLVLECRPPKSYPTGNIYWGISRPDSNQLKAIDNNDRVVLGYDGKINLFKE